jgi:predicted nucleotidyltransferase
MSTKTQPPKPTRRYQSPDVPMSVIRRYARRIVKTFQPEQVLLFGSYAFGQQREGSDVDLLVVMPASNEISKAARISYELEAPFDLDLIVRTPEHLSRGLRDADWFLREIMETGKVLYGKPVPTVGSQGRSRLAHRAANQTGQPRSQ